MSGRLLRPGPQMRASVSPGFEIAAARARVSGVIVVNTLCAANGIFLGMRCGLWVLSLRVLCSAEIVRLALVGYWELDEWYCGSKIGLHKRLLNKN